MSSLLVRIAQVKLQEIKGRLNTEVEQATNKNNVAELFVRLLKEWQEKQGREETLSPALMKDEVFSPLMRKTFPDIAKKLELVPAAMKELAKPHEAPDLTVLDEVFGPFPSTTTVNEDDEKVEKPDWRTRYADELRQTIREFCDKELEAAVKSEEISTALNSLLGERLLSAEDQTRVRAILKDDELVEEYASLLTIMLRNIDKWEWNGPMLMKTHFFEYQRKFRGILQENLDDALVLQIVGDRLSNEVKDALETFNETRNPRNDDDKPREDLRGYREWMSDLFNDTHFLVAMGDIDMDDEYNGGATNKLNGTYRTIMALGTAVQYFKEHGSEYGGIDALTVVQTDVKKLCNGTAHNLLERMLEKIGITEKWRTFIGKAIRPKFYLEGDRDTVYQARRGSLMGHKLTQCMSEIIMFVLDTKVFVETKVPLIRFHDDITFWGHNDKRVQAAWSAVNTTLKRMGLAVKMEGSGHVKIPIRTSKRHERRLKKLRAKGFDVDTVLKRSLDREEDTVPRERNGPEKGKPALPKGPVQWRMLRLSASGDWELNEEFFSYWCKYWHALSEQDPKCVSVMKLIKGYNMHGQSVRRLLCPSGDGMGPGHARLVRDTLSALHKRPLPNSDHGMIGVLKEAIARNHPDCKAAIECLVDGWFYWPIRAGGLALKNFHTVAQQNTTLTGGLSCYDDDDMDNVFSVPKNFDKYLEAKRKRDRDHPEQANDTLPPGWRKVTVPEFKERGTSFVREAFDVYINEETWKVQNTRPKWVGDFDYKKCRKYERWLSEMQDLVKRKLSKACVDITDETGPKKDAELKAMISEFLARKSAWVGAVKDSKAKDRDIDTSTNADKLGPYFSEVMRAHGKELMDAFGSFGIIPADLVPHALIRQICHDFSGDKNDDDSWINV